MCDTHVLIKNNIVYFGLILYNHFYGLVIIVSLISRNITRALNKGVEFAKRVADGDLTATVELDQKDEVGFTKFGIDELISPESLAAAEI